MKLFVATVLLKLACGQQPTVWDKMQPNLGQQMGQQPTLSQQMGVSQPTLGQQMGVVSQQPTLGQKMGVMSKQPTLAQQMGQMPVQQTKIPMSGMGQAIDLSQMGSSSSMPSISGAGAAKVNWRAPCQTDLMQYCLGVSSAKEFACLASRQVSSKCGTAMQSRDAQVAGQTGTAAVLSLPTMTAASANIGAAFGQNPVAKVNWRTPCQNDLMQSCPVSLSEEFACLLSLGQVSPNCDAAMHARDTQVAAQKTGEQLGGQLPAMGQLPVMGQSLSGPTGGVGQLGQNQMTTNQAKVNWRTSCKNDLQSCPVPPSQEFSCLRSLGQVSPNCDAAMHARNAQVASQNTGGLTGNKMQSQTQSQMPIQAAKVNWRIPCQIELMQYCPVSSAEEFACLESIGQVSSKCGAAMQARDAQAATANAGAGTGGVPSIFSMSSIGQVPTYAAGSPTAGSLWDGFMSSSQGQQQVPMPQSMFDTSPMSGFGQPATIMSQPVAQMNQFTGLGQPMPLSQPTTQMGGMGQSIDFSQMSQPMGQSINYNHMGSPMSQMSGFGQSIGGGQSGQMIGQSVMSPFPQMAQSSQLSAKSSSQPMSFPQISNGFSQLNQMPQTQTGMVSATYNPDLPSFSSFPQSSMMPASSSFPPSQSNSFNEPLAPPIPASYYANNPGSAPGSIGPIGSLGAGSFSSLPAGAPGSVSSAPFIPGVPAGAPGSPEAPQGRRRLRRLLGQR